MLVDVVEPFCQIESLIFKVSYDLNRTSSIKCPTCSSALKCVNFYDVDEKITKALFDVSSLLNDSLDEFLPTLWRSFTLLHALIFTQVKVSLVSSH